MVRIHARQLPILRGGVISEIFYGSIETKSCLGVS